MRRYGMLVAGVDIGSRASKAVITEDGDILSYSICDTGPDSAKTALLTIEDAMKGTGLSLADMKYIVATGYGRILVPFAHDNISEIACHAKGANWHFPTVRTVLDIGGEDVKAINCDERGRVTRFVMNDKCAGGTGRFLELIADLLQIPLRETPSRDVEQVLQYMARLSLQARAPITFSSVCVLFAKSEAMAQLNQGASKGDILAGLHEALSTRCFELLCRISIDRDFCLSGGVAKDIALVAKLRDKVGLEPLIPPEPLITGAMGAALFAQERASQPLSIS